MWRTNPQRMAWLTVLLALGIFILFCAGSVIFARWLAFESPTGLRAELHVGQGTVSVASPEAADERAVRSLASVGNNDRLSTDNVSQGYVAFSDSYSGQVIATVLLRRDSVATLTTASRPRFNWSSNAYLIRLTGVGGRAEVWVNEDLDRPVRVVLESGLGATYIEEHGHYFVNATPDALTVTVRVGSATLVSASKDATHLAAASEGVIHGDQPGIQVEPGVVDLLPNWDFHRIGSEAGMPWPVDWSCTWDPSPDNQNGPPGAREFIQVDGRLAVHISRLQPEPGPGEMACVQYPGGRKGFDVSGYDSLWLRVTLQVHHQSLSACGDQGTECPVMLRMVYEDEHGNTFNWYHGFYAEYRPAAGGRATCAECREPHEQINKDAWYSYESGNLLTDLPYRSGDLLIGKPAKIIELKFYAGGHQYDMLLNEVALLARGVPVPADAAETTTAP